MPLSKNPREWISRKELKGAQGLSYPAEIDAEVANFFELKFVKYERDATLKSASEAPNSYTIFLPVPLNLSDETVLNYNEYESFGGLDNYLQNPTSSAAADSMKGVVAAIGLAAAKYVPELISGAVARKSGLAGDGGIGSRAGKIVSTKAGALINPALAIEFRGVQRKNYNFAWRMTARSKEESLLITSIIDAIRWNILPEKVQGDWILTYPNIAFMKFHGSLEYGNGEAARQIIQFAPQGAVCASMNVTYNGSSNHQVFFEQTGEPVEVAIQLSFTDRGIVTKENVAMPGMQK